jgi:predicted RNase H-like HicB family nuclease
MNKQYEHYSMIIQWSERDDAYIVTVPELPGCKTHGSTYEEAVRNGQEAIETWIDGSRAFGLPIPEPRTLLSDVA